MYISYTINLPPPTGQIWSLMLKNYIYSMKNGRDITEVSSSNISITESAPIFLRYVEHTK